jgi:hypothetical protein
MSLLNTNLTPRQENQIEKILYGLKIQHNSKEFTADFVIMRAMEIGLDKQEKDLDDYVKKVEQWAKDKGNAK